MQIREKAPPGTSVGGAFAIVTMGTNRAVYLTLTLWASDQADR